MNKLIIKMNRFFTFAWSTGGSERSAVRLHTRSVVAKCTDRWAIVKRQKICVSSPTPLNGLLSGEAEQLVPDGGGKHEVVLTTTLVSSGGKSNIRRAVVKRDLTIGGIKYNSCREKQRENESGKFCKVLKIKVRSVERSRGEILMRRRADAKPPRVSEFLIVRRCLVLEKKA